RLYPNHAWIRDAFPLSPTFDTPGWFTASAEDMRTSLEALIGLKPAVRAPRGCYLELPGLDPDVAQAYVEAANRFAPAADSSVASDLQQGFAPTLGSYHTTVAEEAWAAHQGWADRFRDRYDPVVWQRLV